jgi:hypothetical protein
LILATGLRGELQSRFTNEETEAQEGNGLCWLEGHPPTNSGIRPLCLLVPHFPATHCAILQMGKQSISVGLCSATPASSHPWPLKVHFLPVLEFSMSKFSGSVLSGEAGKTVASRCFSQCGKLSVSLCEPAGVPSASQCGTEPRGHLLGLEHPLITLPQLPTSVWESPVRSETWGTWY